MSRGQACAGHTPAGPRSGGCGRPAGRWTHRARRWTLRPLGGCEPRVRGCVHRTPVLGRRGKAEEAEAALGRAGGEGWPAPRPLTSAPPSGPSLSVLLTHSAAVVPEAPQALWEVVRSVPGRASVPSRLHLQLPLLCCCSESPNGCQAPASAPLREGSPRSGGGEPTLGVRGNGRAP